MILKSNKKYFFGRLIKCTKQFLYNKKIAIINQTPSANLKKKEV